MAAPVKIGRALAALILDDLPHSIAEMAQEYGVKPPKVALKFGDRLSRADAHELYSWAIGNPDFRYALRTPSNPAHGIARGFFDLTNFFLHDFPQGANGEPAEWSEPLSPAIAGFIAGTREKIEASELTPREARDFIAWGQMQPDFREALHDRRNPEHAEVLSEWQALHERAASEPAAAPAGTATAPIGATPAVSAHQARIAELKTHPAYFDGRHPEHRAVVAELGNLLAGVPDGTRPAPAAGALSGMGAPAAASKPGATAAPGAAAPPANRAAELTQALRGNRFFGSTDRRQTLAALESELLASGGTGGTEPAAASG